MKTISRPISNQRGQTLIEYIIIVAIVGVGSIVLMRSVGKQINVNFARVIESLGGTVDGTNSPVHVSENALKRKDMTSFFKDTRADGEDGNSDKSSRK